MLTNKLSELSNSLKSFVRDENITKLLGDYKSQYSRKISGKSLLENINSLCEKISGDYSKFHNNYTFKAPLKDRNEVEKYIYLVCELINNYDRFTKEYSDMSKQIDNTVKTIVQISKSNYKLYNKVLEEEGSIVQTIESHISDLKNNNITAHKIKNIIDSKEDLIDYKDYSQIKLVVSTMDLIDAYDYSYISLIKNGYSSYYKEISNYKNSTKDMINKTSSLILNIEKCITDSNNLLIDILTKVSFDEPELKNVEDAWNNVDRMMTYSIKSKIDDYRASFPELRDSLSLLDAAKKNYFKYKTLYYVSKLIIIKPKFNNIDDWAYNIKPEKMDYFEREKIIGNLKKMYENKSVSESYGIETTDYNKIKQFLSTELSVYLYRDDYNELLEFQKKIYSVVQSISTYNVKNKHFKASNEYKEFKTKKLRKTPAYLCQYYFFGTEAYKFDQEITKKLNFLTSGKVSRKAGNGYHNVVIQIIIMMLLIGVLGVYSYFASRVMKTDGYSWPKYLWEGANYHWAFTDFLEVESLFSLIGWLFEAIWFLFTWLLWAIIWVILVVLCGILFALMYVGLPLHLAMLVVDFYCLISNKFIYKDDDVGSFYRRMEIIRPDKVIMIIAGAISAIGIYFFTMI